LEGHISYIFDKFVFITYSLEMITINGLIPLEIKSFKSFEVEFKLYPNT